MAAAELTGEAVGAKARCPRCAQLKGCFGPPPDLQGWLKHTRCAWRAQLLLSLTQKGDTLQAFKLHHMMVVMVCLSSARLMKTAVVRWTCAH